MRSCKGEPSDLTAEKARYSTATYPNQPSQLPTKPSRRRRIDRLAGIWDDEVVPMLVAAPGLRPIVVFREISHRHPEFARSARRTLERRVRYWQSVNDPEPDVTFRREGLLSQRILAPLFVSNFLRSAHQGKLRLSDLPPQAKTHESISDIFEYCKSGTLVRRNKALLALAVVCGLPLCQLAKYPVSSTASLYRWRKVFVASGFMTLMQPRLREQLRYKDHSVTSAIFKILHEPPELHNFPRTNWRQIDLKKALAKNGTTVSIWTIRRAIRASRFQWRKAKVVLTSNDPDYRPKIERIKSILSKLGDDECFFSIDEYGPLTIRFMAGRKLCAPDEHPSVPQWQKGRGTIIITGALELRTNQITHFYSDKKNTAEMVRMVDVLRRQYRSIKRIYLSWDAAGWHISKALGKHVEFLNGWAEHDGAPTIDLAPLPSRAQFLNVIESVFSGMSRAVIHNSNFEDLPRARSAIDRYFLSRNEFYNSYPKRAGRKLWQQEICEAVFQEQNNCKDPRYR
jgi:hypothetical protein